MKALRTIRISAAVVVGAGLTLMACAGGEDGTDDPAGQVLQVVSLDSLEFDPPALTATAGEITIEHDAQGSVAHTFVMDALGVSIRLVGDDEATFELEPGEYTYFCDVPGHQAAGMEGTLTVTG